MFMYMCMYVYMYAYVCVHIYIYIYIYIYILSATRLRRQADRASSSGSVRTQRRLMRDLLFLLYHRLVTTFYGCSIDAAQEHTITIIEVSREAPDATTKPNCYNLTSILVRPIHGSRLRSEATPSRIPDPPVESSPERCCTPSAKRTHQQYRVLFYCYFVCECKQTVKQQHTSCNTLTH